MVLNIFHLPVQSCRQACMYHLVLNEDIHVYVSIFSIKCNFHVWQLPRDFTSQKDVQISPCDR